MSFQQLIAILRARQRTVVFAAMLGVMIAAGVTMLMPEQYKANASLMVGYRQAAMAPDAGVPAPLYSGFVATQMDLVTSEAVGVRAVRELGIVDQPQRRAQFEEALAGAGAPIRGLLNSILGLFRGAKENTANAADRAVQEQVWAERLRRRVQPTNGANSSIIQVNFTSADPEVSKEVVNAFARAYLDTSVALNVAPAKDNAHWFDDQVAALAQDLEQAQAELSDYQREQGIVATDERLDNEQARLMELSSQLTEVQAQSYDMQSKKEQAARFAASGGNSGLIPDVLSNPMVLHLKQQISEQQAKLNELSGQVGSNHPNYRRTVGELASLKKRLSDEIATVSSSVGASVEAVEQRQRSLTQAVADQKRKLLDLRAKQDRVEVLKARVENAQEMYDNALQRVSQVRMESHNTQSNVSLINAAMAPTGPSGPKVASNLVLGFLIGLAIGMGLALWREVRERTVRSKDDLREGLGVPVLAIVGPHMRRTARGRPRRLPPRQARIGTIRAEAKP